MRESFKNQSQDETVPDSEIKKTKETEIKPEEFLNELSGILTAMEAERANFDRYIETTIRQEAKDLGIEISEDGMREIIDNQQKEFKKEVKGLKKKFLKNIAPYVLLILMAFSYWRGSGKEIPFAERHIAQAQMMEKGITDSQRRACIPGVSELLYNIGFASGAANFLQGGGRDAWRLYLGLPQKDNTFSISNYKPSVSVEDKYYYKINKFVDNLLSLHRKIYNNEDELKIKPIELILKMINTQDVDVAIDWDNRIMGIYKLEKGQDEKGPYISYYDKWDISAPGINPDITHDSPIEFGKRFEIYDRIHFNPETFEVIEQQLK